jgi:uncharacterized protein
MEINMLNPLHAEPYLSSLSMYPLKAATAVNLDEARVTPRGLMSGAIGDRRWMVIDENNRLVSQREKSELARVKVALLYGTGGRAEKIATSVNAFAPLILDPQQITSDRLTVTIHSDKNVSAHLVGKEADGWFSEYLKSNVRMVYQTDDDVRQCDESFAIDRHPEWPRVLKKLETTIRKMLHLELNIVSFADGYPILVTNLATFDEVNQALPSPVTMDRYRPNMVIGGVAASSEKTWYKIEIGKAALALVKPCARCVVTTIDQATGVKRDMQPFDYLKQHRSADYTQEKTRVKGGIFGENALPTRFRTVRVGDPVKIRLLKVAMY